MNQSRAQNRSFQELMQYYAMERFLYRLAQSEYADRFLLKGRSCSRHGTRRDRADDGYRS